MNKKEGFSSAQKKEYPFTPRIINPVKIQNVLIFSADEQIRQTKDVLEKDMPWITVDVLTDPLFLENIRSEGALVLILDDVAINLANTEVIRQKNKDVIIALLSANEFIHCSHPSATQQKYPYTKKADFVFAYNKTDCAPHKIIQSVVRAAEDQLNVNFYSNVRRFIFLIVDDEPRWFSQFLPVLYSIIGQRADVIFTRTYEESLKFLFGVEQESDINEKQYLSNGHGDDVICLITDIFFPKGENPKSDAGKDLVNLVQKYYPRIPTIIASKTKETESFRNTAFILPKGDPESLDTLRNYIRDHAGITDFIIRDTTGDILYRIKNIQEMTKILDEAGKNTQKAQKLREILEVYAQKDSFSTWLYMHSYRELGNVIRPIQGHGRKLIAVLKKHMKNEMDRVANMPLVIDGKKVYNLGELLDRLTEADPAQIQILSDNDIFSSWLDRRGYSELAEELRPIHGSGIHLIQALCKTVEKWKNIYTAHPNKKERM
ncbi:MAG: hypothetical protein WBF32_08390 [Candidatus Aminicenantaceae bacterium]